jgi:hypothetical protein
MTRQPNSGSFRPGPDPRRHPFTHEERCRGYVTALERLGTGDARVYAWLWRRIRAYYRRKAS